MRSAACPEVHLFRHGHEATQLVDVEQPTHPLSSTDPGSAPFESVRVEAVTSSMLLRRQTSWRYFAVAEGNG